MSLFVDVSVIIPAKNEDSTIGQVVRQIKAVLPAAEVLVVDDGSTDNTRQSAIEAGATVISHLYSKGNGAAIKSGARNASREVLIFMDADGQHNPDDIPRLLEKMVEGYDLVVGARRAGSQASLSRGVANRFYNWLASFVTGHKVEGFTSGFRVARREKFLEFLYLLPNGFSYPTTSTMAFFRAGYSVAYIPITAHTRSRLGKSHIRPIRDGIRFLLIIFKIGTLYSPLKLFVPISASMFMLGLAYYAYTFFVFGRFTNMSALLFTTGLVVFMVGLVSEQITALMYRDKGQE